MVGSLSKLTLTLALVALAPKARCSGRMVLVSRERMMARSMTLRSSRTLPGQS